MSKRRRLPFEEASEDEEADHAPVYTSNDLDVAPSRPSAQKLPLRDSTNLGKADTPDMSSNSTNTCTMEAANTASSDTKSVDIPSFPDDEDFLNYYSTISNADATGDDDVICSSSLFLPQSEEDIAHKEPPLARFEALPSTRRHMSIRGRNISHYQGEFPLLLAPPVSFWRSFCDNPYASTISTPPTYHQSKIRKPPARSLQRKSRTSMKKCTIRRNNASTTSSMVSPRKPAAGILGELQSAKVNSTQPAFRPAPLAISLMEAYPESNDEEEDRARLRPYDDVILLDSRGATISLY